MIPHGAGAQYTVARALTQNRAIPNLHGAACHTSIGTAAVMFCSPAMPLGIRLSKFGPKQQYLRGIIYPEQDRNDRRRGSIARCDPAPAQVEADEELAGREQRRGHKGAHPRIAPGDGYIRQDWMASASFTPISPPICATIAPCAASRP